MARPPLRIAHLNFARTWRGGEQQTLYLAQFLQNRKITQTVVGYPESELETRCREAGVPFFAVHVRNELNIPASWKIARFIMTNQIELLHAHTAKAHGIALMVKRLCQLFRYPLKLIVSRRVDFHAGRNWLSQRKYRSPLVDAYIAISQKVKEILLQDGIAETKIYVVYSGIDTERFVGRLTAQKRKTMQEEFQSKGHLILGNVAALTDHKDQKTLLSAAAALQRQKLPCWKLLIIGDGELRPELEKLADELQLNAKVIFTGFRRDIPDLLHFMDIFVMSSKEEGLGTSLIDAMAAGLPIVATQAGGIPEIVVHKKGGLLSPVGDANALAVHLARLLCEPRLRQNMASFNRRHAAKFHYHKTGAATLKLYRSLLRPR